MHHEDWEEAICTARYDSFIKGPEMAARERLAELRKAQKAPVRLLTLLYPAPPRPEPDERTLAGHPFQDLPVVEEEEALMTLEPDEVACTFLDDRQSSRGFIQKSL